MTSSPRVFATAGFPELDDLAVESPRREGLERRTTSHGIDDRKRADELLAGEVQLLEMIARGESLPLVLEAVCRLVEDLANGSLCSILLLDADGLHLRHGAAPSLPRAYTEAIDGGAIGPAAGSCGTAAFRGEPVIVSDISTDPLWKDYTSLALSHGLRACWSAPILSSENKVLGTFAMYYREPRIRSDHERHIIGQVTHVASIALERMRNEQALRQARADLAHVDRVATMGQLTATLAHEVHQPIAAAVINAQACVRFLEHKQPNIEQARAAAQDIIQDGTRAAEIINGVRALFQKDASERELVDINKVIQEIVLILSGEALRCSVSVRTDLDANLPCVRADRVQMLQVMLNLITNGIDAMKDVTVSRTLTIESQRAEHKALLVTVSDTGAGLDAQHAHQIFNPFFTTKKHGTGMGLSISRSIVESHGGRLWADADSQRGARFCLTLPVHGEPDH